MHQQVRTSPTRTGGPGPGAEWNPGGITEILEILAREDVNLQTVGGRDLDTDGELVFAVHHDDDNPDGPGEEAAKLLRGEGFDAETFKVRTCDVDDEPGALLKCLQRIQAEETEPIYEIFVGTSEAGTVPIQVTTRSMVARGETSV